MLAKRVPGRQTKATVLHTCPEANVNTPIEVGKQITSVPLARYILME